MMKRMTLRSLSHYMTGIIPYINLMNILINKDLNPHNENDWINKRTKRRIR